MVTPEAVVDGLRLQTATVFAELNRECVYVRMHPLDIDMFRRHYVPDSVTRWDRGAFALLGYPVIGDCAVPRGCPVPEYAT